MINYMALSDAALNKAEVECLKCSTSPSPAAIREAAYRIVRESNRDWTNQGLLREVERIITELLGGAFGPDG